MVFKDRLEDYSEAEFREFLRCLFEDERDLSPDAFDAFLVRGILHFEKITEHPSGLNALLRLGEGVEECINRAMKEVVKWRLTNNKPGFKSE
ncbi:bacteriocin immunity protein [Pseudomonas sp. S2_C03]